jgi:hypothetical protein
MSWISISNTISLLAVSNFKFRYTAPGLPGTKARLLVSNEAKAPGVYIPFEARESFVQAFFDRQGLAPLYLRFCCESLAYRAIYDDPQPYATIAPTPWPDW